MGLYPFPPPAPNSASTSFHGQNRSRSDWINTKKSQVPTQVECQWKDPRDPQASPCGFAITSTDCAEHHLRTAHGEDSDLQRRVCHWDGCGREFTSGWFFRHFHRSHHPYNRMYCDSCEEGFQDGKPLQNHIAKYHSNSSSASSAANQDSAFRGAKKRRV
ncbi:hypothetical protein BT96DRAFT_433398 [Gymnopus androsaceus JB14]|uniref:C2H2-type domain-containing protein n=1 Tax=Gymnopus androsaceus JB14 TaxID=1447944 RepID=A0A6A4I610_9AGAR|nr:hypothetical protein BT96DRAFT_433398 [Gymnopus androsaceus JB14]